MIQNLIELTTADKKRYYEYPIFQPYKERFRARTLSRDFDISDLNSLKMVSETTDAPLSFIDQLHGTEIASFKKTKPIGVKRDVKGDIFMTNVVDLPLMIRTADCACVVIYDPVLHVCANIHAGWKGIAKKAVAISVSELSRRYGCERKNMISAISPMLGPCCAAFTDAEKELPHFMRPFFLEEGHVDLWAACENQLVGSGVLLSNTFNPRICTFCNTEYFFSYRREREKAGRFGTITVLNKPL